MNKFKPQFNEIITSLQFNKLSRQNGGKCWGWMGRLWLSAIECKYKELDRQLKEQFIHSLSDTDMLAEIIRELTKIQENTEITSENMLYRVKRVGAQRDQSAIMSTLTEAKEFDKIKRATNT